VTGQGLTAGGLEAMQDKHAHVTNELGQPITGDIYDAVVDTLSDVLGQFGVPDDGRVALLDSIAPLRAAIVADPDATDPGGYPACGAPDVVR
jgi:hypothetical protein